MIRRWLLLSARALKKLIQTVPYVWGLTGTPAPNSYLDLWPEMYLLDGGDLPLADYLEKRVFAKTEQTTTAPQEADTAGFKQYLARYRAALPLEKAAESLLYGEE